MIVARNLETRKFLEQLMKQDQRIREERGRAKKEHTPMRLARIVYHIDGSETKIWRDD